MCVIEVRTYTHADGRREIIESKRPCHTLSENGYCNHVYTRNLGDATLDERRPSSRSDSQSDDMYVTGRDGTERRYQRLTRTRSHRVPRNARDRRPVTQSPVDSVASPTTSLPPTYQTAEIKPSAFPSARYNGPSGGFSPTTRPADPYQEIRLEGAASTDRPPSFNQDQARTAPNPFSARRPSSTAEFGPPLRRPTLRPTRPSAGGGSSEASSSGASSFSGFRSPLDPGHSRNDSGNDIPTSRLRADSLRADEELARRLQKEEERQAEIERQRLSASGRRRRDSNLAAENGARRERLDETDRRERDRRSRQAEHDARQRAAANERAREASRERTERKRREAQDTLEGRRRERELNEKADAELRQMERERENAAALKRESVEQYQESRSSPSATRITYSYGNGSSPTVSTRSPTGSARPPPAMVHNYPSASTSRRNSTLLERGDAVIERERRRMAGQMNDAMAGMSLEAAAYDENAVVDADARNYDSQRARRERREAERRERQRQEDQRKREDGFF